MKLLLPGLLLVIALVWCTCDEGHPIISPPPPAPVPAPPGGLFGVPADVDEDISMLLMWVAPDTGTSPTGYDVYRSVNGNLFEKINESTITATSFGPIGQDYPLALSFADTSYDTASAQLHKYYVVSVGTDSVSDPSDTVSCIPNTISRDSSVANITPEDGAVSVDRVPTLGWDAKASAASYFVFLREADEYYPLWMHRCFDITCGFKITSGTTYLVGIGDSLESIHEYEWLVWAISSDNCGFALSEGTFTTTYSAVVGTVVDAIQAPGFYTICWDQTDDLDVQVPEGIYAFHMVSNSFDDLGHPFEIADDAEHVGSICDTPVTVPSVPYLYQTGDIIPIKYSLPEEAAVRIDIVR
ncbi:MAG: hypothetical protein KOO62_02935 [candidate division Zixibacteria bacterium]|nr:hypothetical protein [candidate division Zixibacteria bacterium]